MILSAISLEAAGGSLAFGMIGIVLTFLGYKVFEWLSPIEVEKELAEKQNIAVAIVAAAIILGTAMVAASVVS